MLFHQRVGLAAVMRAAFFFCRCREWLNYATRFGTTPLLYLLTTSGKGGRGNVELFKELKTSLELICNNPASTCCLWPEK